MHTRKILLTLLFLNFIFGLLLARLFPSIDYLIFGTATILFVFELIFIEPIVCALRRCLISLLPRAGAQSNKKLLASIQTIEEEPAL
jgi:hypothetical protein